MSCLRCRFLGHKLADVEGTTAPVRRCKRCGHIEKPDESPDDEFVDDEDQAVRSVAEDHAQNISEQASTDDGIHHPRIEEDEEVNSDQVVQTVLTCTECDFEEPEGKGWIHGDSCPNCKFGYLATRDGSLDGSGAQILN